MAGLVGRGSAAARVRGCCAPAYERPCAATLRPSPHGAAAARPHHRYQKSRTQIIKASAAYTWSDNIQITEVVFIRHLRSVVSRNACANHWATAVEVEWKQKDVGALQICSSIASVVRQLVCGRGRARPRGQHAAPRARARRGLPRARPARAARACRRRTRHSLNDPTPQQIASSLKCHRIRLVWRQLSFKKYLKMRSSTNVSLLCTSCDGDE